MKHPIRFMAPVLVALALVVGWSGQASAYSQTRLMDDQVFDNVGSLNSAQVADFLAGRTGPFTKLAAASPCLSTYTSPNFFWDNVKWHYGSDADWNTAWGPAQIPASTVIAQAAAMWGLNPEVIVATLQKEESLVTGTSCDSWRYNSAMGYGCPDSGGCNPKYVGFNKQVLWGAWQLKFNKERSYGNTAWDGDDTITYTGYMTQGTRKRCGSCSSNFYDGYASLDGQSVYLENGTTASLYTYTPHLGQSFPGIFEGWFGSTYGGYCRDSVTYPDATSNTNLLFVFSTGTQSDLQCTLYNRGWSANESLGGGLTSTPAAVSPEKGSIDVFARGGDNGLWHRRFRNGWGPWESLGGTLGSAPAVTSPSPGVIDVFASDGSNGLIHKRYDHGWGPWESLGGTLNSAPAAVSPTSNVIDVFARDNANGLIHKRYDHGWGPWESLGGSFANSPSVVSMQTNIIDIFTQANDNTLQHRRYDRGWTPVENLGGSVVASPAASSIAAGIMDIFSLGADNTLQHRRFAGGWQPWESLAEPLISAPTAAGY